MSKPNDQEYYGKCLDLFRNRTPANCEETANYFYTYLETYADEIEVKNYLSAYHNISFCLVELLANASKQERPELERKFKEITQLYLEKLSVAEDKELASLPTLSVFGNIINFTLLTQSPDQIGDTAFEYYQKFRSCVTEEKIKTREFLDRWLLIIDNERRHWDDPQHYRKSSALAQALLKVCADDPQFAPLRAKIYNILASNQFFYPEPNLSFNDNSKIVLGYINKSLEESPENVFAASFSQHVHRLLSTYKQIRSFIHDTNARTGSILQHVKLLTEREDLPEDAINSITNLYLEVNNLRTIACISLEIQADTKEMILTDIRTTIEEILNGKEIPLDVIQIQGEPQKWYLAPEYTSLALVNLIKNTQEAYARRGIEEPTLPIRIEIDYTSRKVIYVDFAGGIDKSLGDVFEIYKTSKGVQGKTGIGLSQAKHAMQLQNYSLYLKAQQPENGAEFVLDFKKEEF